MGETLVDKIYEQIHEDILSWRLKPMQRLHIAQLAEHFNIGPGPVREALSRLIATGLVIVISQRGFRVAAVSKDDLNDVYMTRAEVEAIALRLSIERGDDQWEADLIASYHRLAKFEQEQTIKSLQDYKEWELRHRGFNLALLNACGLSYLLDIQNRLYDLTERYRRSWLNAGIEKSKKLVYAKKQKDIMDAALSRDAKRASELLFRHYESAVAVMESYFAQNHLFTTV
jgi:GntR family carbon starvation induced transcriptional regulator